MSTSVPVLGRGGVGMCVCVCVGGRGYGVKDRRGRSGQRRLI